MTDAEIDSLEGLDLLKAVTEAVGWRWYPPESGYPGYACDHRASRIYFDTEDFTVTFDDALAACEAAKKLGVVMTIKFDFVEDLPPFTRQLLADSSWTLTPEDLCRSLLVMLAARD